MRTDLTAKGSMGTVVCRSCHEEVFPFYGSSWLPHDEDGWNTYHTLLSLELDGTPAEITDKADEIVQHARAIVDAAVNREERRG